MAVEAYISGSDLGSGSDSDSDSGLSLVDGLGTNPPTKQMPKISFVRLTFTPVHFTCPIGLSIDALNSRVYRSGHGNNTLLQTETKIPYSFLIDRRAERAGSKDVMH